MIDTEFTQKTGIKVKVSAMPDANKITLAIAANETPDIGLGLTSYMPFDLASRGALYDLTKFDDFWSIADRFIPGSFVPYVFNEGSECRITEQPFCKRGVGGHGNGHASWDRAVHHRAAAATHQYAADHQPGPSRQ